MSNVSSAKSRIHQFIIDTFPLARQRNVSESDSLLNTGIVDSLGVLEIVNFLEKEFNISIADEELLPENFEAIHTLTTFVLQKAQTS